MYLEEIQQLFWNTNDGDHELSCELYRGNNPVRLQMGRYRLTGGRITVMCCTCNAFVVCPLNVEFIGG